MRIQRLYLVPGIRVFEAPVHVHYGVFVALAILGIAVLSNPAFGAVAVLSYLAIIVIHELGHAIMAKRIGLRVLDIEIGWLHGQCRVVASGDEWDRVLFAWGGVLAQVAIAVPVVAIAFFLPDNYDGLFGPVLIFLGYINLMMAGLNLVPAPSLDGNTAWRIVHMWFRKGRSNPPPVSASKRAKKRWGVRD